MNVVTAFTVKAVLCECWEMHVLAGYATVSPPSAPNYMTGEKKRSTLHGRRAAATSDFLALNEVVVTLISAVVVFYPQLVGGRLRSPTHNRLQVPAGPRDVCRSTSQTAGGSLYDRPYGVADSAWRTWPGRSKSTTLRADTVIKDSFLTWVGALRLGQAPALDGGCAP